MVGYYEIETKQEAADALKTWWDDVRWKPEDQDRTLPILSIRVLNEADKTVYSANAKDDDDWTESRAFLELLEALEAEMLMDPDPRKIMLRLRVSPFPDEKKSKQKGFTFVNEAMIRGRSLRAEEIGERGSVDQAVAVEGVQELSTLDALRKLLPKTGPVSVDVNALVEFIVTSQNHAFRHFYEQQELCMSALRKSVQLYESSMEFAHRVIADHPQIQKLSYDHAENLRRIELEENRKLQQAKEEGKSKVLIHGMQTIGSVPDGPATAMEFVRKISALLPG